jgi:hypothetical protein
MSGLWLGSTSLWLGNTGLWAGYSGYSEGGGLAPQGGTPTPTPPVTAPYVVLLPYDVLTGNNPHASSTRTVVAPIVANSTAALEILTEPSTGNGGVTNNTTVSGFAPNTDPNALYGVWIDPGPDPGVNNLTGAGFSVTLGGTAYSLAIETLLTAPTWLFFSSREPTFISVSAQALRNGGFGGTRFANQTGTGAWTILTTTNMTAGSGTLHSRSARLKIDQFVRIPSAGRPLPQIAITVDDTFAATRTFVAPEIAAIASAAGVSITPTAYLSNGWLGTATRMTETQAAELKSIYGWALCVDSGNEGEPLCQDSTTAGAVARLNANRDALLARSGLGMSADEAKHMAYSFGFTAFSDRTNVVQSASTTGLSTTLNMTGANGAWGFAIAGGMKVKGTGAASPPTVVACPLGNRMTLDTAVNIAASTPLTFCGNQCGVTFVANGTTTLTNMNTTGIVAGQELFANGVSGNVVVSVDVESTTVGVVTMTSAVSASVIRGDFLLRTAAFYPGKLSQAMLDDGWRTGRVIAASAPNCAVYGMPPTRAVELGSASGEGANPDFIKRLIDQAILNNWELVIYIHAGTGTTDPTFWDTSVKPWLEHLATQIAAGKCTSPTIPQMWANWQTRVWS